jgi:hypothetical protein
MAMAMALSMAVAPAGRCPSASCSSGPVGSGRSAAAAVRPRPLHRRLRPLPVVTELFGIFTAYAATHGDDIQRPAMENMLLFATVYGD